MKVKDVLKAKRDRGVVTVLPGETVEILAHKLRLAQVGALIVSGDGSAMLGIVSERDIARCLAERGAEAHRATVKEIMSTEVMTCAPEDSLTSVARQMTARRFRHMPVVERGRLVGMVSIGDIVKHRLAEVEMEADVLRDIAMAGH
ncbi:CBS domain-containing protein [Pikeienuella piscinae]|uniref:CBS domain-containing protein n=1 Tax=Pikeienuella piscinae TaxID=2748098 RepID=A0A7L5BYN8_9RHOB|nr:CBS domain-containing protein [Pikeienuella piscinae]QIE55356.1 CBS domain-containing protein [Pikeienuella piscinae]